jgi:ABC-type branched-subunit amino acid transport system ATPase component
MKLAAHNVTSGYGRVPIIHGATMAIPESGIVAILGPNGAGKSTLLKTLARQLPVMAGELTLDGRRYDGRDTTWAARSGIALVAQTGNVFADLTVEDNLRLGALHNRDWRSATAEAMNRFPVLRDRARQSAGSLSGGERQLLAVSSALLMRPRVLLLDEPTTGLSPLAAQATAQLIDDIVADGVAVAWVVEQMPELALRRSTHAYFVEAGQLTFFEDASELLETGRLEQLMLHKP